ncbi:MAG TPA: XRE family transcriptional regulator [Burkholderiaceae bacterium]|nr:XRE family transcriptional regulator [Burkholderiaceae bacterium]HMX09341.1 XRE family transcriptional regulator [Burkholderiaceae bacterium]HMY98299.1 XRE family transcriptional regulator [Burkholderiaceae bacterium]HNB44435.1 XRE family transcriptional regulator [Burkholderiaceae bacterium]HNG78908.1 XRE family transcriptional regulator [Burkholderiaceae bacterium]
MIHERIRRARLLRGLSLEALARSLGDISKQGLSKFEKGGPPPNSTRLLQLAKALSVKPEYFFRPDGVKLSALEFRKLARMPQKRQDQIGEQMRDHLERYASLERCFEPDAAAQPPLQPPRTFTVSSAEQAEGAAEQLREQWAIGGDAIAHLAELLEEHGIKVVLLDDHDGFDGACAATHDEQHVLIALNGSRPGERIRFTAAHELGHWVMDLPADMTEKDKETCCHRFAGAFLYPAERVRADFGSHCRARVLAAELLNAKLRYGVSMGVALRRLKDLGLITDGGYTGMNMQFSAHGWRKVEPKPLLAEQPRRFESLVYRALAEDLISLPRAAELMQCPVSELDPGLARLSEEPLAA